MRIGGLVALLVSLFISVAATIWLRSAQTDSSPLWVVVTVEDIRSGEKINRDQLRVIPWYNTSMPEGSFARIEDIPWSETGPFAMSPIRKDNMILSNQISRPNQKPTLSGLLSPGMVATTIQVNTISGVAGFVLPEERVDVILNRAVGGKRSAEVIIENLRVLAVDNTVDPQSGKAVPAKSVTFEINREDAQRLTLAASLGELTLALRAANAEGYAQTSRISEADIGLPRHDTLADSDSNSDQSGTQSQTINSIDSLTEHVDPAGASYASASQLPADDLLSGRTGVVDFVIVRGLSKNTQSIPIR